MKGLESKGSEKRVEAGEVAKKHLDASELVNLIGYAGPGTSLDVRVTFPDGKMCEGYTKWRDDRAPRGPVVVLRDATGKDEGIIELGGHIIYSPVPPTTHNDVRARARVAQHGGETQAIKMPIEPHARQLVFELLPEKE